MYKVDVEIKGITPLLMHRFLENEPKPEKRGEDIENEEIAEHRLYKNDKGEVIVPNEWIIRAMFKVASDFKVEGMRKKTMKSLLPGNIYIEPEAIKIEPQKWAVDKRTVVIPSTRGRVMRFRPKFENWKLSFKVLVMDDRIKPEILHHILEEAGRRSGIGDGRSIGFGRFIVSKFGEPETQ